MTASRDRSVITPATQPLLASARRALAALAEAGSPPSAETQDAVAALDEIGGAMLVDRLDELLAPLTLLTLTIDEHGRITPEPGPAPARLVQHGWNSFLIRIRNPHQSTVDLNVQAPRGLSGVTNYGTSATVAHVWDRVRHEPAVRDGGFVLELPEPHGLSGLEIEYRAIHVSARDPGRSIADILFVTDPMDPLLQVLRPRDASTRLRIEFDVAESRWIELDVREADGSTCTASVRISDAQDRVYPARVFRLAPDMPFQDHIYRSAGEMVRLPPGDYRFATRRGPESRAAISQVRVDADTSRVELRVDRWVDPGTRGYYSGDAHVHAAGCGHYDHPSEGVTPETIIRHVRGEGLHIANVLNWGPGYFHQRQYFTGESVSPLAELEHPELQRLQGMTWQATATDLDAASSIRYDLEISQFPSGHSGHLILVGLTDQDYPGADWVADWPSWTLPILRWASAQGATVGYAHCGNGLHGTSTELPNFDIPAFTGVGANAAIIDAANGIPLFLAGAEIDPAAELTLWYHLMNVGYRVLMLGETDFPCLSDQHPGDGRTYLRLPAPPVGATAVEDWLAGLRHGPSYFGEGRSHLFDVAVDGSTDLDQDRPAGRHRVTADVAAWLEPEPEDLDAWMPNVLPGMAPAWHIEHARIAGTRDVAVELVVNGHAVAQQIIRADGVEQRVDFEIDLERSSWIALRVMPSSHSQPIFVHVDGAPIRSSRQSAQWLRRCVDAIWESRSPFIRDAELDDARAAYDEARAVYDRVILECADPA